MPYLRRDKQLMLGFKAGRRESLAVVYRAYEPVLRKRVRKLLRMAPASLTISVGTEADIVHDAFARAFADRARCAYDGARDYGPYLYTIAKNLVTDAMRRCNREQVYRRFLETEVVEAPDVCFDVEMLVTVRDYLATLPEPMLAVYHQRFVIGQSQRRACAALRLERGQLRVQEARLTRGLRLALQAKGLLGATA